jgi:hypothetical protein
MFVRKVILSSILVGAFASAASAVSFTAETRLVLKFGTLPAGVSLLAEKDKNKDSDTLGTGVVDTQVKFGGNDVDRFTIDSLVTGEANDVGSAAGGLARGKWTFTLTNTTNTAVFIDLRLKLEQLVNVSNYGPLDHGQAVSDAHSPGSGQTAGGSLLLADTSSDTDLFAGITDFLIKVKKNDALTFSFVGRSIGTAQAVPEPSSIAALGLGGLVLLRRRKK